VKGLAQVVTCLLLLIHYAHAQSPVADFTASAAGCRQQVISLQNNSTAANSYAWDFCLDDIRTLKSSTNLATMSGFSGGNGYKLIESNGQWFGFATSYSGDRIYRLEFGSDPTSFPTVTNLGNPGGLLHSPEGIDIVQANGQWYGFVGSLDFSTPTKGVVRLDFGNSLLNSPTAKDLGDFGINSRLREVKVIKENTHLILLVVSYGGNSIVRVNYRDSFDNLISAANISSTGAISGVSLPVGIDWVYQNSNLIMVIASLGNNRLIQLNFGASILSTPNVVGNYSFAGLNSPVKIKILQEGSTFYGLVGNASTALDIIDFKDLNPTNAPVEIGTTGMPSLVSIEPIRWKGTSVLHGVSGSNTILRSLVFQSTCDASFDYKEVASPSGLTYSSAGTKEIELLAFNTQTDYQGRAVASKKVTISSLVTPDIDFTFQNQCAKNNINFTSTSLAGGISSYAWTFGEGGVASAPNPSYAYLSSGTYTAALTIGAANGCQNSIQKQITVYNAPQATFTMPSASPICTSQSYSFLNTSSFDASSAPTWQWSINGSAVSSTKDLAYSFVSNTSQQIQLTASIPGCSTQSTQTINSLAIGPLVNFTVGTVCQSTPVTFTNTTAGSVTSYSWNFGDGNTSSQTSPQNSFATIGQYTVTLQANNAAGCQNTLSKSVTIYSKPQPDFSIGLPPFSCSGTASQFTDATPNPVDSNLSSWSWNFGDAANGTSTSRNPAYTYTTAASYLVSLTVGTNFGCTNTLQKSVTISPSPVANFTNTAACKDQTTQFNDTSTGTIQSRTWTVQGNLLTGPNPTYTFSSSGSFLMALTITGSNGCIAQVSKSITVPVPATLDFSVDKPCVNNGTLFKEITNTTDPSVSQAWVFGSIGSGTGTSANFNFPTASTYNIKLSSTRQSGCTYSVTKAVSISAAPIAGFTPSVEAGAAPLPVTFTNTSTGAASYAWQFGDAQASTSTLTNPAFTYTSLGEYTAALTAFNTLGCSTTSSTVIRVVIPAIDLVMSDFYLSKDAQTGILQPVVTITNNSNVTVTDPVVVIDIAGGARVQKQLVGSIKPTKDFTQVLDFQLLPQAITYVCAEVQASGDTDLFLNRKCVSVNDLEIVLTPFPNPATETLTLDWVSKTATPVSIDIFNASGNVVFQQSITSVVAGLNRLTVSVEALPAGVYFIRFSDTFITRSFRFAVTKK